jgi:hypothetical protein
MMESYSLAGQPNEVVSQRNIDNTVRVIEYMLENEDNITISPFVM